MPDFSFKRGFLIENKPWVEEAEWCEREVMAYFFNERFKPETIKCWKKYSGIIVKQYIPKPSEEERQYGESELVQWLLERRESHSTV